MTDPDATPDVMSDSDDLAALDTVLRGGADADNQDLSAFVDDLVAVYVAADDLEQSPALRQFTSGATASVADPPVRRRWSKAAAAVVGTVAGKVVLGSAVAVAAVGGLHASDTVDVPFLPDTHPANDEEIDVDQPTPTSTPTSSPPSRSEPAPAPSAADPAPSTSTATVDGGDVPVPSDPAAPDDGPPPDADVTIPAPTVPPTSVPDTTPPILDPDVLPPGVTVPDNPS